MSRTINKLVEDGLVVREVHKEDRRYITIKLTDNGMKIFKSRLVARLKYTNSFIYVVSLFNNIFLTGNFNLLSNINCIW